MLQNEGINWLTQWKEIVLFVSYMYITFLCHFAEIATVPIHYLVIFKFKAWQDDQLRWNGKEYQGTNQIRLPVTDIWMPDIRLYNG